MLIYTRTHLSERTLSKISIIFTFQAAYDVAMVKLKQEYTTNPTSYNMHKECTLWSQHWLKCAKELNQWDSLLELAVTRNSRDPFLILESSWRNPNWPTMKEALAEVEYNCPRELGIYPSNF